MTTQEAERLLVHALAEFTARVDVRPALHLIRARTAAADGAAAAGTTTHHGRNESMTTVQNTDAAFVNRLRAEHEKETARAADVRKNIAEFGAWLQGNAATIPAGGFQDALRNFSKAVAGLAEAEGLAAQFRGAAEEYERRIPAASPDAPGPVRTPSDPPGPARTDSGRLVATGVQDTQAHPAATPPDTALCDGGMADHYNRGLPVGTIDGQLVCAVPKPNSRYAIDGQLVCGKPVGNAPGLGPCGRHDVPAPADETRDDVTGGDQ